MNQCFNHEYTFDASWQQIQVDCDQTIDYRIEKQKNIFFIDKKVQAFLYIFIDRPITTEIIIYSYAKSDLTVRLFILFPERVDVKITIFLCGNEAKCLMYGAYSVSENDRIYLTVRQIHCAVQTLSEVYVDGLLSSQGSFYFDGMITIMKSAHKSSALQNNKNILLSSLARVVSVPSIQVLHNEVKCYHGAAIGYFEKQHQDYLRSRGLDESEIKKLLIGALYDRVIKNYEKREFILQKIYEKI